MTPKLRASLAALTILAMALAPLLMPAIGSSSSNSSQAAYASVAGAPVADNGDNDGGGDNDGSGDNNGNGNNNGNSNGNSNSNGNDNNTGGSPPPPSQSSAPAAPPPPACSTPGQESSFQSDDGRIVVHVFGSMPQSVRFSIRIPIDPASVPTAPGPVVGGLLFQLIAETCDGSPIAVLPAEVNLGIHYADADAAGLTEANFTIGRLDTTANQWRPSAKQATDPGANFSSATITDLGYYVLYQRS